MKRTIISLQLTVLALVVSLALTHAHEPPEGWPTIDTIDRTVIELQEVKHEFSVNRWPREREKLDRATVILQTFAHLTAHAALSPHCNPLMPVPHTHTVFGHNGTTGKPIPDK